MPMGLDAPMPLRNGRSGEGGLLSHDKSPLWQDQRGVNKGDPRKGSDQSVLVPAQNRAYFGIGHLLVAIVGLVCDLLGIRDAFKPYLLVDTQPRPPVTILIGLTGLKWVCTTLSVARDVDYA